MSHITITQNTVRIEPTHVERALGLIRPVDVPLDSITVVDLVDEGMSAVTGVRAPGLGVPFVRALGTWRRRRGKAFVDVRRNQPAVRIEAPGSRFDTYLIGADDAVEVARELRRASKIAD